MFPHSQHMGSSSPGVLGCWQLRSRGAARLISLSLLASLTSAFAAVASGWASLRGLLPHMRRWRSPSRSFTQLMNAKAASFWMKYVGNPTRAWWSKCSTTASKACSDSLLIWVLALMCHRWATANWWSL